MAEGSEFCQAQFLFPSDTNNLFAAASPEQCAYALEHCHQSSIFNMYKLYFCTLQTSNTAFFPIGVSPIKEY